MPLKPFRAWSWSAKLAVLLVGLSILPISIVTAYTEYAARREFIDDIGIRNLQQAGGSAALIGRFLDDVVGDVRILAGSPAAVEVLGAGNPEMRPRLTSLMDAIKDTETARELQVLDATGTIVASTELGSRGQSRTTARIFPARHRRRRR